MVKCKEDTCNSEATYGFKFAEPIYCKTHGLLNDAESQFQICRCGSSAPKYKEENEKRASCCAKCKTETMKTIGERRCNCAKRIPTYGMPEDKRPDFCSECKLDGMINLKDKNKKCSCKRVIPSFGFPDDKKPTCCIECKKEGMINMTINLCPCGKSAVYGYKGDKKPSFCMKCAKEGMENIITKKRCKCGKAIPTFGKLGDKKASCCVSCKTNEMVNIYSKMCKCGKAQPVFGLSNDATPTCCAKCKEEGMIDIKTFKCKCGKQPVFGLPGDKKASCCASCKTKEMVNIKAKMCVCGKSQPIFAYDGDKKAFHCSACKKDGMVDIISSNSPTRFCKGTFELQEKGLKCPYDHRGKKKYDYYCTKCFERNFPNDPRTALIRDKTHEMRVRDFLVETFKDIQFIHNKPLWTGNADCTCRRRIDFRTLVGNTLLCVEVDEDQHKYRDQADEEIRYDDLMMLHGGKFIFLRFNPDSYVDAEGRKQYTPMEERLEVLEEEIRTQMERIQTDENELVEIINMFYDETDED